MSEQAQANNPRFAYGKVVSTKMQKTITVLVERTIKHPKYGKFIRRSAKVHAHDENNQCHLGDYVRLKESRPYSKTKSWEIDQILKKNEQVSIGSE